LVRKIQSARYKKKDLRFARHRAMKAEQRVTRQEIILSRLRLIGGPLAVEHALLGRLYDRKRRAMYRLKRMEDFFDVNAQ
jgi:hypothetical protein